MHAVSSILCARLAAAAAGAAVGGTQMMGCGEVRASVVCAAVQFDMSPVMDASQRFVRVLGSSSWEAVTYCC